MPVTDTGGVTSWPMPAACHITRAGGCVLVALALVIGTACQSTGPSPVASSGSLQGIDLPSPLTGPGRTTIDSTEKKAIGTAWGDFLSGTTDKAKATIARFSSPQADLMRLQIDLAIQPTDEIQGQLQSFVEDHPQYAAGWVTLSAAAEIQGDESLALRSARQSSQLWPSGSFNGRADELEHRWITSRIESGREALAAGQPMEALSVVEQALDLDPDNQSGLLLRAEALVQLRQGPEAEVALARLGALPEALLMRAEMASAEGHWQQAMDLIGRLPDGYPDKDQSLRRAQLMWRMSILPPHVQEAVTSEAVTREQLVVILVAMFPSLEVQPGGATPLMTDVIDLPSQRAILAATRLDIISVDRAGMLFHPQRVASLREIETAIDSVCHIASFTPPLWCKGEMTQTDSCILIEEPVMGRTLVEVLLSVK